MRILGWTLMRPLQLEVLRNTMHEDRARARMLERDRAQLRRDLTQALHRAEFAEATVQGQNGVIAQLTLQSERMLGIIADMRRLGFAMPADLGEPNDALQSVADDDAAAVKADPTLAASEWE